MASIFAYSNILTRPRWLSLCLFFSFFSLSHGNPDLTVSPRAFAFGTVGHRKQLTKTVTISNGGTKELTITKVRSSCSCTKVTLDNRTLAPGEETVLTTVLSTGRIMGALHKYVELISNDPRRPRIKIPVTARIHADVKALPWTLPQFKGVVGGKTVTQEFTLQWRASSDKDLSLTDLKAADPRITARALPVMTGLYIEKYKITLTITPPDKEGYFSSKLTGKLNGLDWEFPVHGMIFAGIIVSPHYFQFGKIETAEKARSIIQLQSADGTPFQVTGFKSVPDMLKFDVSSTPDNLKHTITARIAHEDRTKRFFSKIEIQTTHPRKPVVKINCLGFWAPQKK